MYVFILEWTPALTQAMNKSVLDKTDNRNPPIPHGNIDITQQKSFNGNNSLFSILLRIHILKLYGCNDDGIEFL